MESGTQDNGGAKPPPKEETAEQKKKRAAVFMQAVAESAGSLLNEWVGEERAAEARGRVVAAFQAAAMSAKNPADFYNATLGSVALCVAVSALTGMMPGTGASALAYLVPRRPRRGEQPQLQFQLSHRGLCALARRAGLVLVAVPAGMNDTLAVTEGEVSTFAPNIDDPPMSWDDMRGVVVIAKDAKTGAPLFRGWVAKKLIAARRDGSDSFTFAEKPGNEWAKRTDPWHVWPVEMAMKCALHYAVSRGWAVIDDTEAVRALSIDAAADVIDVQGEVIRTTPVGGPLGDLGLKPREIEPHVEDDPLAGLDEQVERDRSGEGKVPVEAAAAETKPTPAAAAPTTAPPKQAKPPKTPKQTEPAAAVAVARDCADLETRLTIDQRKAIREKIPCHLTAPVTGSWPVATLEAYRKALQEVVAAAPSAEAQAQDVAAARNRRALLDSVQMGVDALGEDGANKVAAALGLDRSAQGVLGLSDEQLAALDKALSVQVEIELGGELGS